MTTLLVGFDSAWTAKNSGALVGVLHRADGMLEELGPPSVASYREGEEMILEWQTKHATASTLILLDQPTVVPNAAGQRPVENLVASPVSLRYGGVQPANTARHTMFGTSAPLWPFLTRFGGAADPIDVLESASTTRVYETYPVLLMIALGWTLPDKRAGGRLPKYNPARGNTFAASDWRHVCDLTASAFRARSLLGIVRWLEEAGAKLSPRKSDQDRVDACLCLLAALYVAEGKPCLMIGERETGYIVVPSGDGLRAELEARCHATGRAPSRWVRVF